MLFQKFILTSWILAASVAASCRASAQDMIQYLDLKSDEFTKSDMTRAELEKALADAGTGMVDLHGKRLNNLDLSGMDLRRTKLQAARLNGTNLTRANLDGVVLDQAWVLKADLTGASLRGASLFSTQFMDARMDGADFTGAHVAGDFAGASATGARFDKADLSADMKNQSMGLMRGSFKGTKLDKASVRDANMARVFMEFASLRDADLTGANLMGAELAGADLRGATVSGANFMGADVSATKLVELKGKAEAHGLDMTKNLDRAVTD